MSFYFKRLARTFRKWLLREAKSEIRSYQQLQWVMDHLKVPIPSTSYSLQPSTINWIVNEIMINDRRCIVELGSGTSTQIVAQALALIDQEKPKRTFISVDENADWVKYVSTSIEQDGNLPYVDVTHVPRIIGPGGFWYDEEMLSKKIAQLKPDLIIVDGPSVGSVEQQADRSRVHQFFKGKIADNFAIFIDDTNRKEERVLANAWAKQEGAKVVFLNAYIGFITKGKRYSSMPG